MTHRARRTAKLRRRFATATGAIDLASILVGVIIVAVIAGVLTTSAAIAIPWAQDQGAKQALNNLRIAEASANVKTGVYLNETDLVAGKFIDSKRAMADVPADGSCYIGAIKSQSGTILWISSGDNTVNTYKTGDTSICSDLKRLTDRVQGIDPDAGNTLNLSYGKQTFDPNGTSEVLSPTVTGGDTYTYTADKDLSSYGVGFDGATGKFTGKPAWNLTFTNVATSYATTCGIANAAVYCWGRNDSGQTGNGNKNTPITAPARVTGIVGAATALSVGEAHACAVAGGQLWCWGDGANGDLGLGNTNAAPNAQQVTGLNGKTVTAVAAGQSFTCAVASAALYCWGINTSGQIGTGDTVSPQLNPVKVAGLGTVTAVAAGQTHTCAVSDGKAYCWGANASGQVGNAQTTSVSSATAVSTAGVLGGLTITDIEAGEAHTCAIAGGAAYCWGANSYGQLGNASSAASSSPVKVTVNAALTGTVTSISAGRYYSCAVANGAAACWGYGGYGNIGNGGTGGGTTPLAVSTTGVLAGKTVTSISASDRATCAAASGTLVCWGTNNTGQLGNDSATGAQANSPVANTGTGTNAGLPADVKVTVTSKGYSRTTTVKLDVAVK